MSKIASLKSLITVSRILLVVGAGVVLFVGVCQVSDMIAERLFVSAIADAVQPIITAAINAIVSIAK